MFDFYVPNNSMNIKIPYSFFERHMELSWLDVYFGIQSSYISTSVAIEKALAQLYTQEDNLDLISSIAISAERDVVEINGYILELVDTNGFTNENLNNKWLYFALYYLYENRNTFTFPMEHNDEEIKVTSIYEAFHWLCSDFNNRVYYMPDCLQEFYHHALLPDMYNLTDKQVTELCERSLEDLKKLIEG